MTTKTPTADQIAEQYAASQRETERLAAKAAAITEAEQTARRQAEIEHFTDGAGPRARQARDGRDAAKRRLDDLAGADQIDLTELFTAFTEFKTADAKCGALRLHASRINYVNPLGRNGNGVERSHVIGCSELHERLTWASYLDWVVAERTKRARVQHAQELEAEAAAKISAAGEQARTAAAAETNN